jgi:hypothetical protein
MRGVMKVVPDQLLTFLADTEISSWSTVVKYVTKLAEMA